MANYTTADIKALRERTGAGMLDVKKALDEADGDIDKALEIIRVKGLRGVAKREGRATADGVIVVDIRPGDEGEVEIGRASCRGRGEGAGGAGRDMTEG